MNKQAKTLKQPNGLRSYLSKYLGVYVFLLVMIVGMTLISDKFLTLSNILNILRQISVNAIIAFGMTYCILLGGIDRSAPSRASPPASGTSRGSSTIRTSSRSSSASRSAFSPASPSASRRAFSTVCSSPAPASLRSSSRSARRASATAWPTF